MYEGRIMKGIGGFYYVNTDIGLIECKPRGIFRKDRQTPLVGDKVLVSLIEGSPGQGIIREILPRKNMLLRPSVANVQQCVVVVATQRPQPDLLLLDRLLVLAQINEMDKIICINKMDLDSEGKNQNVIDAYRQVGYVVLCTSTKTGQGITKLKEILKDRVSVFAGMSGVGKSSIMNSMQPGLGLKTGGTSQKLKRGRHTTRHVELLELDFGGMVVDTPGFSSLSLGTVKELKDMEESEFTRFYPEFGNSPGECRFAGCRHISEPDCSVKMAVERGGIAGFRYRNYIKLLEELRQSRRKKYD
ncbi:MAG: ribosome small subunit-dependent GTPase A [Bacillota bacterium]